MHAALQLELFKNVEENSLESLDVRHRRRSHWVEGKNEVTDELTRKMKDATPSSIDPVRSNPHGSESAVVDGDMRATAGASHTQRGGVFTEQESCAAAFTVLIDQPSLKLLDLGEVHRAEQIDFQRRFHERRSSTDTA